MAPDVKLGFREGKRLAGSHTAEGGRDSNAPLCVEKRLRVPGERQVEGQPGGFLKAGVKGGKQKVSGDRNCKSAPALCGHCNSTGMGQPTNHYFLRGYYQQEIPCDPVTWGNAMLGPH